MITRLIFKELREHGWIMLCLVGGVLLNVLLLIEMGLNSEFQVSGLSIIRTSLIYLFPLMAIILADRLITREYLQRTRLFMEALPSGVNTQLVVKFFIGLVFLILLAVTVTTVVSYLNQTLDSITPRFLGLLLIRATVFTVLLWCIAFCFSLFGRVRWFLYLIFAGAIVIIVSLPGIDSNRIPALSLISSTYFAFERDILPVFDIVGTLLMAAAFLLVAVLLTQRDKGSLAEKLASPLSRFDMAAIAILLMGSLSSFAVIMERDGPLTQITPGKDAISFSNPSLIITLPEDYEQVRNTVAEPLHNYLSELQRLLGYPAFAQVVVTHRDDVPVEELIIGADGHIAIRTRLDNLSPYDLAALYTAAGHGVLSQTSSGRASFEPYHWLLDGVVRYQAERQLDASGVGNDNHQQLVTMAAFTQRHHRQHYSAEVDLSAQFQLLTDRYGYHMGIAAAYSAVDFLVKTAGEDTLKQLINATIGKAQSRTALTSLAYLANPFEQQFQTITNLTFNEFQRQWRQHLFEDSNVDHVLVSDMVSVRSSVDFDVRDGGFLHAVGNINLPAYVGDAAPESCRMRFQSLTAFDLEVADFDKTVRDIACSPGDNELTIASFFDTNNRYYFQLDVRLAGFDRPWVVRSERLSPETGDNLR